MELADTSAWTNRHKDAAVRSDFDARVARGEIGTCDAVEAELLWTARSRQEFESMRKRFRGFVRFRVEPPHWDRAIDVWTVLVTQGRHRQVAHPDLLIAAVAERAGIAVLHYDHDFEVIADVTGQPERAIAPLGSL